MSQTDCICNRCTDACQTRPGWFRPGEAERVADHLGLTLPQLFRQYLGVDWCLDWVRHRVTFGLAPRITTAEGGTEYPADPHGTCIFFQEGRCAIHAVKPYECRQMSHADSRLTTSTRRRRLALLWQRSLTQLCQLLGRFPQAQPLTGSQLSTLQTHGVSR